MHGRPRRTPRPLLHRLPHGDRQTPPTNPPHIQPPTHNTPHHTRNQNPSTTTQINPPPHQPLQPSQLQPPRPTPKPGLHSIPKPIPPQPMGHPHHRTQPHPSLWDPHTQLPHQTRPQAKAQDIRRRRHTTQKTTTNPRLGTPILPHFSWSSITASHTK